MSSLLGTALLFPLGFLENGYADIATMGDRSWFAVAVLGVLSTFVAFLIFFWAVSRFGPSRGVLISYLAPVAGLLFAFIVLGDQPAPVQLAGADFNEYGFCWRAMADSDGNEFWLVYECP